MNQKEIKELQAILILLGHEQIIANGEMDKVTKTAITHHLPDANNFSHHKNLLYPHYGNLDRPEEALRIKQSIKADRKSELILLRDFLKVKLAQKINMSI